MNDKRDELDNMLWEKYRSYLEALPHKQLVEYFDDMTKKQLMDIIQEADPVGRGDGAYE